jgi:hypothetical protein
MAASHPIIGWPSEASEVVRLERGFIVAEVEWSEWS